MALSSTAEPFDDVRLKWMIFLHLTFIGLGVLFAVMEWLGAVTDIRKEEDRAAISWRWPVPR